MDTASNSIYDLGHEVCQTSCTIINKINADTKHFFTNIILEKSLLNAVDGSRQQCLTNIVW
jgi:hypothetical protein